MQLQLDQKFAASGFNKIDSTAAEDSIIGSIVSSGSELQTYDWLQSRAGLDELLDYNFGSFSLMRLYKISNKLLQHQPGLEAIIVNDWHLSAFPPQRENLLRVISGTVGTVGFNMIASPDG